MLTLKGLLVSKNIKPTFQRLKIFKYLREHKAHPTADNIYRCLVKEMPTMSKTTVYNTLKMLFDKGLISEVTISGKEARFDDETGNHHHFLCERCGKVIDLEIKCPICDEKEIHGHKVRELHGYFKGICSSCRGKK